MIGVKRGEATEFLKKPPLPVGEITKPAADGPPVSSPSALTTEIFFDKYSYLMLAGVALGCPERGRRVAPDVSHA